MTLEEILAQVQMGGLSPEAAGKLIRQDGYKEMDYANSPVRLPSTDPQTHRHFLKNIQFRILKADC